MEVVEPGTRYQLAEVRELLCDPSRIAILCALMDGSARPAGELARMANVAPATASAFAIVHWPDWMLVGATFGLGLAFTPMYIRSRNLWPLAIR